MPAQSPEPGGDSSVDLADFTPERALARIIELRAHLKDELLPEAEARSDSTLVAGFVRYLDVWALQFGNQVNGPLELLAFVARNLLEFNLLLQVVFETADGRALFLNEALRLDVKDLDERLSKLPSVVDATLSDNSVEDLDWLPISKVRLVGKRDTFDAWFHKFCSKLIHPTAIMILAPQALTGPEKRQTLCFAGVQYLGRSYNFLTKVIFDR